MTGPAVTLGPMTDMTNFNQTIIDEFRANGGKVGGGFAGMPMVAHHHEGRQDRASPGSTPWPPGRGRRDALRLRLQGRRAHQSGLVPQPGGQPRGRGRVRRRHATPPSPRSSPAPSATEIYDRQKKLVPGLRRLRGRHDAGHPRRRPHPQGGLSDPSAGEEVPAQPHEAQDEDHPADRVRGELADHVARVRHRRGPHVREPPQQQCQQPRSHPTPRTTPC